MKRIVKVFPDYCSSGVWRDGCNADPDELGISAPLQLALKYWHEAWEFIIAEDMDDDAEARPRMAESYIVRWQEDGKKLAEMLSDENPTYEFIYLK